MRKISFLIVLLAGLVTAVYLIPSFRHQNQTTGMVPAERTGGQHRKFPHIEVGTGWSTNANSEAAITEALLMARKDSSERSTDLLIIFATSGSDMKSILTRAREIVGTETKIYGGTSDSRAVMTNDKFAAAATKGYDFSQSEAARAVAVMTITTSLIKFGVGSANCEEHPSPREAAKHAAQSAIRDSGEPTQPIPKVILLTSPRGQEEETILGVQDVVGAQVPIMGGTAGGPRFAVFGNPDKVNDTGVSMVAVYTDLPIGLRFEGGCEVDGKHSGVVTKVDGQEIIEIDSKPALDVYNEWLDGHIDQLFKNVGDIATIRTLLNLHPICRKYSTSDGQDRFLFSHPYPKDPSLKNRSIMTSTNIQFGERIYLGHGSWESLLNRIGSLPTNARLSSEVTHSFVPLFSIGYICAGIMGVIPEQERDKMPFLINYANDGVPFIAPFTWGEQGYFPGIGNKHGNLLMSFLVVGIAADQ